MFLLILWCICLTELSTATGPTGFLNLFGLQRYCFCRCGVSKPISDAVRSGRLLGGEHVTPHQFPWLATINVGSDIVGGSLISGSHILTAASPLYGLSASNLTVTLGVHDRCSAGPAIVNSVSSLTIHPMFSPTNGDNNIAIITLRHPVAFNEFVSPICLPFYGYLEQGRVAWVATWSEYSGNASCTPRVTTLPMLPKRSCLASSVLPLLLIDKGCLGPVGSMSHVCKTDVGAPVMSRWSSSTPFRLLGVVSSASCLNNSPPLYTRVVDHTAWIYSQIRSVCLCF